MKAFVLFSLLLVMTGLVGCSTWNKDWTKNLPWSPEFRLLKSKFETPTRMIAIWTPDVLSKPGHPPTRGLGGRLYFYNERSQPIPVEGQLMVYGFDDSEDVHQSGEPDRKFAFTADQFTKHYSKSDLGASYSVWIPWDAAGGETQSVSLVPIFTATSGQIVTGHQAAAVLPGRHREGSPALEPPTMSRIPPISGVKPVSHYEPSVPGTRGDSFGNTAPPARQLRTSTISVSPNLQRHLLQGSTGPQAQSHRGNGNRVEQTSGPSVQGGLEVQPAETAAEINYLPNAAAQYPTGPAATASQPPMATIPAQSQAQQLSARFERLRSRARSAPTAPTLNAGSLLPRFHAAPPSHFPPPSTPTLPAQNLAAGGLAPGNSW